MKLSQISLAMLTVLATNSALAAQSNEVRRPYIVQLSAAPVASYTGGINGLKATKPAAGQRLNVEQPQVQTYQSYLAEQQAQVLELLPEVQPSHQYRLVFNGFSAMLTDDEVRALKKNSAVAAIRVDQPQEPTTNYTPGFLKLDIPDGIWAKAGGQGAAGEDVIIGVIDSGVWPENPAFADRVDENGVATFSGEGSEAYGPAPAKWKGSCQAGEGFSLSNCNNKLIGAQYFDATYRRLIAQGLYSPHWSDYVSPRDNGGHGTHTASTAGGNAKVDANVAGVAMGYASGIAPRARIAAYKVCWSYKDPANPVMPKNSCFTGDNVAAIEKAVADGVDVINYSISGSQTTVNDPVELAFLGAANAGVFVAASAGNSGPGNAVAHLGPWLTTVGASTHDRLNAANVVLDNGASYQGGSLNQTALAPSNMIRARDAALPGVNLVQADLCYGATDGAVVLDPAKVAGKVVICDRGTTNLVNKSLAVSQAGGVGTIISNVAGGSATISAFAHVIPTVHLSQADGTAVKNHLLANNAATAAMTKFSAVKGPTGAPMMAGFSSRGPNRGYANMLKPDLTAPGVDILAGYVPATTEAERNDIANGTVAAPAWDFLQGTSMSSPHVAGLAALLKQQHPDWSPAMIKSALMTTGSMTLNDGLAGAQNGTLPWGQGAGHVMPNKAVAPGLVYDIKPVDYVRFLCGINAPSVAAAVCANVGRVADYNLNLPSITIANNLGSTTVQRTVTNVGDSTATYTATAAVPGYQVSVSPASITLAPKQSATFNVTTTRTSAAIGSWAFGGLVWSDGVNEVKSPVSLKSVLFGSVAELTSEQTTGRLMFPIGTGFAGAMSSAVAGLKAATVTPLTIGQAPSGTIESSTQLSAACRANAKGTVMRDLVVPVNTVVLRAATFNVETSGHSSPAGDDIDLILLNPANTVVATSLKAGSDEQVQLLNPAAGTYKVCLGGYQLANNTSSDFNLSTWAVSTSDKGGSFRLSMPGTAVVGGTPTVSLSWSGLASGKRYLAGMRFISGASTLSTSVLTVNTNDPLPMAEVEKAVMVVAE